MEVYAKEQPRKKPRSQRVDQRIVCQLDQRIVYADTRTCASCTQDAAARHGAQQSPQRQARASEQQSPQTKARAVVANGTTGDDDRARGGSGSDGPALRAEAPGPCGKGKRPAQDSNPDRSEPPLRRSGTMLQALNQRPSETMMQPAEATTATATPVARVTPRSPGAQDTADARGQAETQRQATASLAWHGDDACATHCPFAFFPFFAF